MTKAAPKTNTATKKAISKVVGNIVFFLVIVVVVTPLVWCIFLSLRTHNDIMINPLSFPETFVFENYVNAFSRVPYVLMIKNTLIVIGTALPTELIFSIFAAFAISRMKFGSGKLQNFIYTYFVSGVVLPVFVLLFPVYMIMVNLGIHDTLLSTILPHIGWVAPLNMLLMSAAFRDVPTSIEEAALMDGCGIFRIIFTIFIPVTKSCISTVLILNFLGMWNDFALARVMLNSPDVRTLSLAAILFKGEYSIDYGLMTAGVFILILPQLIIFTVFQKYIIEGVTAGAVKG